MIKVTHLTQSDYDGGAARAAFRILNSLNEDKSLDCILRVNKKITNNKKLLNQVFKGNFLITLIAT